MRALKIILELKENAKPNTKIIGDGFRSVTGPKGDFDCDSELLPG